MGTRNAERGMRSAECRKQICILHPLGVDRAFEIAILIPPSPQVCALIPVGVRMEREDSERTSG